ncbi:MAG: threonylcarbamoyl-AMP synthase [Firmicutes bacterium]|nr:threonylcarbamoyl-AMP synthase [Bacillota bacterium]
MTKIFNFKNDINEEELNIAANCIKDGKLVIFPTETVYGIGANALDEDAVDSIFIAKGRANDNPLIVHISDFSMLEKLVEEPTKLEQKLMDAFMPGPFTLILKKKDIIPDNVSANLDTVGIRMPANKIAHDLIKTTNLPIAAPSANISSRPSGTKVEDIKEEFQNKVDIIIDGGETSVGLESTVVKVIDGIPTILRPGKITPEDIIEITGICKLSDNLFKKAEGVVESPGMKYKHYAPNNKCILVYSDKEELLIKLINSNIKEKTLIIGNAKNKNKYNCYKYLSYGTTLEEISHNIFSLLREADIYEPDLIIIEGVKKEGLGIAIMNRLIRASSYNYIEE